MTGNYEVFQFPPLFKTMSSGKVRFWELVIHHYAHESHIVAKYGFTDGKVTDTKPTIITQGKNIGKANETSIREQAFLEAQSKWNLKVKKEQFHEQNQGSQGSQGSKAQSPTKSATKSVANAKEFRPMLAHKLEPSKSKFNVSYIAQPKLDGIRMNCVMINGEPRFLTRTGKDIENFNALREDIKKCKIPDGIILDGELGCFGKNPELTFQEATGIVKRKKGTVNAKEKYIKYVVYDLYDTNNTDMTFIERYNALAKMLRQKKDMLIELCCHELFVVQSLPEIEQTLNRFLDEGYEGLMLRTQDGKYETDKRSKGLLKYKKFTDSEFEIIGFKEGKGNDKKTIIFDCKTPEGRMFSVRPAMTHGERSKMFEEASANPSMYVGKKLTVKYFELSPDGIPRFPVGIVVRDYE